MTSSKLPTLALAAAGAFTLLASSAFAQPYDGGYYNSEETIIVTAPGVQRRVIGRSASTGAPIVQLTEQRAVETADLDLRSDYDVDRLYRRIDRSVDAACRSLDRRAYVAIDDNRQCIRDARRDAFAQADQLIAAARG